MNAVRCTFCDEMNPHGQRNCRSCGAELPGAQSQTTDGPEEDALTREVMQIARDQGMISAIKHYRETTGADLTEAKAAVEAMLAGPPGGAEARGGEADILAIVRQHGKIAAIKRYRELTGSGLKEAKEAVEAMMARTGTQAGGGLNRAGCGSSVLLVIAGCTGLIWLIAERF